VVGITGASGAVYGVRLLERLRELQVRTHLVVTSAGVLNVHHELGLDRGALEQLADEVHALGDVGACIASGSHPTAAMVVAPCSMKTLAAIAHGFGDNLLTRAADVTLKERRRLVLMVRETPFNLAHLRNMTAVTEMGGIVFPPLPAFYHRPQSISELVDDTVERVIELTGVGRASPAAGRGSEPARSGRRRQPALARAQHHVGIFGPAAAAVVAAQRHEEVALLHVQVVAQDHAAEAQIGLHVEQAGDVAIADLAHPEGITCM
jgi:4-hydroxy-3-polyprenylbenzoate decarboxylase